LQNAVEIAVVRQADLAARVQGDEDNGQGGRAPEQMLVFIDLPRAIPKKQFVFPLPPLILYVFVPYSGPCA